MEKLEKLFREAAGNEKLTVKCEKLTDVSIPAILSFSEESRRMEDMFKIYAAGGMNMGTDFTAENSLVVNVENALIKKLAESDSETNALLAKQIYSLAVLSQRRFDENEMKDFLVASYEVLSKLS